MQNMNMIITKKKVIKLTFWVYFIFLAILKSVPSIEAKEITLNLSQDK